MQKHSLHTTLEARHWAVVVGVKCTGWGHTCRLLHVETIMKKC